MIDINCHVVNKIIIKKHWNLIQPSFTLQHQETYFEKKIVIENSSKIKKELIQGTDELQGSSWISVVIAVKRLYLLYLLTVATILEQSIVFRNFNNSVSSDLINYYIRKKIISKNPVYYIYKNTYIFLFYHNFTIVFIVFDRQTSYSSINILITLLLI